jgi:magnesium and cobalt transporter
MTDDHLPNGSGHRTWLARLSQLLHGETLDRDKLLEQLREAENHILDADAFAMIEGVLQVADIQVRDVMVPNAQMKVIESDESPDVFIKTVVDSGHSRFPVIGDSRDDVEGILLAKDLLDYFAQGEKRGKFSLRDYLRPAVFIPESKRLNVLLKDFRSKRNHMAIVADEYGGIAGLVTIEDVLEQIVGEIDDEHDIEDEPFIQILRNGEHTVMAITPIDEFNKFFATDIDDHEFDTIGGVVVNSLGHLPKRGEIQSVSGLNFRVIRADRRRVQLLQISTVDES